MALFRVPDSFVGKDWRQIRKESSEPFRADILASYMGIDETTPITENQQITIPDDPGSAEFQFVSGRFKPGQPTADERTKQLIDAAQPEIDEETKWIEQYLAENPFAFDEAFAKKSATDQSDPHYSKLLEDYVADVGFKRESLQDEQKLLQDLRTTQMGAAGEATRAYQRAIAQAEEGFTGRGLFFSGIKKGAIGRGTVEREAGVTQQAQQVRQREDVIEQARQESIGSGITQRETEQEKAYGGTFVQAHARRFPVSGNAMAGYDIPGYFQY